VGPTLTAPEVAVETMTNGVLVGKVDLDAVPTGVSGVTATDSGVADTSGVMLAVAVTICTSLMINAVGLGSEAAVKLFNAPLANIAKINTPPHKIPGKKPSSIHCQVALPLRRFPIRPYWLILVLPRLNRYRVVSLGLSLIAMKNA